MTINCKNEIEKRYGPWTAHNIQLDANLHTLQQPNPKEDAKVQRILQLCHDLSPKPIEQLRILDLACLEGLYSIELAKHGAQVIGIEGREKNIEKARFAKKILKLPNLEFHQDDVRNLTKEKYGEFDIVLCLGILYHLDTPDVFTFLESIFNVSKLGVIVDTNISLEPQIAKRHRNHQYWGSSYVEFSKNVSKKEMEDSSWASIDNHNSFWFTKISLINFLSHLGFTSVLECFAPIEPEKEQDRITLVALKGQKAKILSSESSVGENTSYSEENTNISPFQQKKRGSLWHRVKRKIKFTSLFLLLMHIGPLSAFKVEDIAHWEIEDFKRYDPNITDKDMHSMMADHRSRKLLDYNLGLSIAKKYNLEYLTIGSRMLSNTKWTLLLMSQQPMQEDEAAELANTIFQDILQQMNDHDFAPKYINGNFQDTQVDPTKVGLRITFWTEEMNRMKPPHIAEVYIEKGNTFIRQSDPNDYLLESTRWK